MTRMSIRLAKQDAPAVSKVILYHINAIVLSLVVCAVIIVLITGLNPLQVYGALINGALGTNRRMWVTLRDALVLLLADVGLVPAFKMRFWNIGAEGQMLMGGLASAALMIYCSALPNWLLIVLILAAGCAAGMVWGIIPAVFKAVYSTNETLFTLMMNYVAMQIITFCIVFWENPAGSNTVGIINGATNAGWFPAVFGLKYGLNLVLVLAVTVFVSWYLRFTKQGYELAVVGESWRTAQYAGISVRQVIVRTMAISGAVCGLAGGRGFTAIIVAWMSGFNTAAMAAVSFLLCAMENGAIQIASQFGLNENVSSIITGIIIPEKNCERQADL